MDGSSGVPQGNWRHQLEILDGRRASLREQIEADRRGFAGLVDIDHHLQLAAAGLEAADLASQALVGLHERDPLGQQLRGLVAEAGGEGLAVLDELRGKLPDADSWQQLRESALFQDSQRHLAELLARGGGALLQQTQVQRWAQYEVRQIVAGVVARHAPADDRYDQLIKPEKLPPVLRRFMNVVFRVLAPEGQPQGPLGIEEGQPEEVRSTQRMVLPLSQAILYQQEEVVPQLQQRLAESPGDPEIQQQLRVADEKIQEWTRLRLQPRSQPIIPEQNFHGDTWTAFTADGEPIISVAIPAVLRSGTNLDRMQELIRGEIVRRFAGMGLSHELDESYRASRAPEAGRRSNGRTPSFSLDTAYWFARLKRQFPVLELVDQKQHLQALIAGARAAGERGVRELLSDPGEPPDGLDIRQP